MAVRRLAEEQPESFAFTPENEAWARARIATYPQGRQASAVIPLLWKAQAQHGGWLPEPAIRLVADMLAMPYIRVFEIATFYTMFQLKPVGTVAHVQVCGTTPCMLRGAEALIAICKRRIGPEPLVPSADGTFSWEEVECAGACVNAPMVQVGGDTYEDLTPETFERVLDGLAAGTPPPPGPQSGRRSSEPVTGPTTLGGLSKDRAGSFEGGPMAAGNGLPEAGLAPTAPRLREENVARPDPRDRPEVEQSRTPAGEPAAEAGPAAPATATAPSGQAPAPDGEAAPAVRPAGFGADGAARLDPEALARADAAGDRPPAAGPDAAADDLKAITGIGPKIAEALSVMGVVRYAQIAGWSERNVAWVDAYFGFPGRVYRDRWIEQARERAAGGKG